MANVTNTLEFREATRHYFLECSRLNKELEPEFISRFNSILKQQGKAADESNLRRLSSAEKFYRKTAELIAVQQQAIEFFTREFYAIDQNYWKSLDENEKLKAKCLEMQAYIASLRKSEETFLTLSRNLVSRLRATNRAAA